MHKKILTLCLSLCLGVSFQIEAGTMPTAINGQATPSLAPMLQTVMPSVVNVTTQGRTPDNEDAFSQPPAERGKPDAASKGQPFQGLGSGVIVDAKLGLIITNAHLTDQAKLITVTLNDGRRYIAKLIGQDVASDIAVLKINATNLKQIDFANPNALQVGDFVVAIGSPFGLSQTVTSGVVSALDRNDLGIEGFENFIQTDASINPGNSGGALVNLQGQLVGINTAILAPNGGNIGIGFAIPADMAKAIALQIVNYGKVNRGIAGVMMQTLTPELANAFNLPNTKGALISQVMPNSPAALAGLKVGDIIEKINHQEVKNAGQVKNLIGIVRAGSKIQLDILRDKKQIPILLVTTDPKQFDQQVRTADPFLYGLVMQNFDAEVPNIGLVQGVQVLHLKDSTPAWQAGLRPGDVITSANQMPIHNLNELESIARGQSKQGELLLNIYRGHGAAFFVVKSA
jgi:serine protease Do